MKIIIAVAVFLFSLPLWAWAEEEYYRMPLESPVVICLVGHWCRVVCPPVEGGQKWLEEIERKVDKDMKNVFTAGATPETLRAPRKPREVHLPKKWKHTNGRWTKDYFEAAFYAASVQGFYFKHFRKSFGMTKPQC